MRTEIVGDGRIRGHNFEIVVTDRDRSKKINGLRLSGEIIDKLVDENVENLTFIDIQGGRYTISMDDWLDYRVWDGFSDYQHVGFSKFSRG